MNPIITRGGDVVNVVPADVRLETFVRGRTVEAIEEANRKVDRALKAGALAVGAQVTIETIPGYLPLRNDPAFTERLPAQRHRRGRAGARQAPGAPHRLHGHGRRHPHHARHPPLHRRGLRDGTRRRLPHLRPRGGDLRPARAMAMTVLDLLAGGAARPVLVASTPRFTRAEYLAFQRRLRGTITFDGASL